MSTCAELCLLILNVRNDPLGYTKPLILMHGDSPADVQCYIGVSQVVPPLAPIQREENPKGTHCYFEHTFHGEKTFSPLCGELATLYINCSLFVQPNGIRYFDRTTYVVNHSRPVTRSNREIWQMLIGEFVVAYMISARKQVCCSN